MSTLYDVVIVGAGPAGLSAALLLGRARRSVLVCDDGQPRNARSQAVHGFLTRDGTPPRELRGFALRDLDRYPTVTYQSIHVDDVARAGKHFDVLLAGGMTVRGRCLMLATGIQDQLPDIPGIHPFYGHGVFHCPYCDGYEVRDQPLVALGSAERGANLAIELTCWSQNVILCTHGGELPNVEKLELLTGLRITTFREPVEALLGEPDHLTGLRLKGNVVVPCHALFVPQDWSQRSDLPEKLGCHFTDKGAVITDEMEGTCVPGLFVTGDASTQGGLAIVAAAEGAQAAKAANALLLKEDCQALMVHLHSPSQ